MVLAVGARLSGQASLSTEASRCASASRAKVEAGLPVIAISLAPRRLINCTMLTISLLSPELDSASTTSSCAIMPRSPWLASPGCTKKAGVPVDASVDAILPPIWPDLPMPVTTTRPVQASIKCSACTKCASRRVARLCTASASMPSTCRASCNTCSVWGRAEVMGSKYTKAMSTHPFFDDVHSQSCSLPGQDDACLRSATNA